MKCSLALSLFILFFSYFLLFPKLKNGTMYLPRRWQSLKWLVAKMVFQKKVKYLLLEILLITVSSLTLIYYKFQSHV